VATYGNGVRGTRSYDVTNQLTSIADRYAGATIRNAPQQLFAETYTRDAAGQLLSTTAIAPTQNTTTNSYTSLLQLQSAGSTAYAYDKADEPTQLGTASLTTDAAGEVTKLVAGATTTFNYDARGNRTRMAASGGATVNYSYDAANRLTSVAGIASGTTTYGYNGDGLRMNKKVGASSAEGFVWDTAEGLPLILVDGTTSFVSGPGGMPLEQIASGSNTALYLLTDQLGSVRALTDSKGQVVATYTYSAYGLMTATTGTASTPLRFAGQYLDAETEIYNMRARYYDPATAQFLTRDPLVPLTKQPYVYVGDNPLNAIDPDGLFGWSDLHHIGEAIHNVGRVVGDVASFIPGPLGSGIGLAADAVSLTGDAVIQSSDLYALLRGRGITQAQLNLDNSEESTDLFSTDVDVVTGLLGLGHYTGHINQLLKVVEFLQKLKGGLDLASIPFDNYVNQYKGSHGASQCGGGGGW
jgi:RHS repeat-associated protein